MAARPGEVLKACLLEDSEARRRRLAGLVAGVDRDGLLDAARYHRVIGYAYRALREVDGVDPGLIAALAALDRQGLQAHLRVLGALKRAGEVLDALAIPWLVVKGPALTVTAYRRPGLRLYYDLDLVVQRNRFRQAIEALEADGFFLVDRNWDLIRRYMIGELVLSFDHGPEVDVHWDFLYDGELRRTLSVPVDELFERARPVAIGGLSVRTLDPSDALVLIAMHACKQGGDRLIWLKDIERVIANDEPSWNEVVERSLAWRAHLFVGAMLLRARETLAADVPDDVVAALLGSRSWRAALTLIDRAFPAERSTGFGTPATLVVRSTRADVRSTLAATARGLGRRASRAVLTGALRRDERQDDPDDPASRAFPTGEPGSKERYLEEMLSEP